MGQVGPGVREIGDGLANLHKDLLGLREITLLGEDDSQPIGRVDVVGVEGQGLVEILEGPAVVLFHLLLCGLKLQGPQEHVTERHESVEVVLAVGQRVRTRAAEKRGKEGGRTQYA